MNDFAAVPENFHGLHALFMQEVRKISTGHAATREDYILASGIIGGICDPAMSGEDYRKWDTAQMRAMQPAKNGNGSSPVDKLVKRYQPDKKAAKEEAPLGRGTRAGICLKGMKHGEVRFEVVLNGDDGRKFQKRLSHAAVQLGWSSHSYTSNILNEKTHQAGETRLLVMVRRH